VMNKESYMNDREKAFKEWDDDRKSRDDCWPCYETVFNQIWAYQVEPLRAHNKIVQELFNEEQLRYSESLKRIKELEEILNNSDNFGKVKFELLCKLENRIKELEECLGEPSGNSR